MRERGVKLSGNEVDIIAPPVIPGAGGKASLGWLGWRPPASIVPPSLDLALIKYLTHLRDGHKFG